MWFYYSGSNTVASLIMEAKNKEDVINYLALKYRIDSEMICKSLLESNKISITPEMINIERNINKTKIIEHEKAIQSLMEQCQTIENEIANRQILEKNLYNQKKKEHLDIVTQRYEEKRRNYCATTERAHVQVVKISRISPTSHSDIIQVGYKFYSKETSFSHDSVHAVEYNEYLEIDGYALFFDGSSNLYSIKELNSLNEHTWLTHNRIGANYFIKKTGLLTDMRAYWHYECFGRFEEEINTLADFILFLDTSFLLNIVYVPKTLIELIVQYLVKMPQFGDNLTNNMQICDFEPPNLYFDSYEMWKMGQRFPSSMKTSSLRFELRNLQDKLQNEKLDAKKTALLLK